MWIPSALFLLAAGTAQAAPASVLEHGRPWGKPMQQGIFVDINTSAFGKIPAIVNQQIPDTIPIDTSQLDIGGDIFNIGFLGAAYSVDVQNIYLTPTVRKLLITPEKGRPFRVGSDNITNGFLNTIVVASTGISDRSNGRDPGHINVKVSVSFLGFINFNLINVDCDVGITADDLGDVNIYTQVGLGPTMNGNGLTGRLCTSSETCSDDRSHKVCEADVDPNTGEFYCPSDNAAIPTNQVDCTTLAFEHCTSEYTQPTVDSNGNVISYGNINGSQLDCVDLNARFRRVDPGDPICESPAAPTQCFEYERAPTQPKTGSGTITPRECNSYIVPNLTVTDPDVTLPDLDLGRLSHDALNCGGFWNFVIDLANGMGLLPNDIITATVGPIINEQVGPLVSDLNDSVKDALIIKQDINLLGKTMPISLGPGQLYVDQPGVRLEMWSQIGQEGKAPNPCVSRYIPRTADGSRLTGPGHAPFTPVLGANNANNGAQYDAAAFIDDDLVNALFYGLWREGLLCQTLDTQAISDLGVSLPGGLALDTSLLRSLANNTLNTILEPGQPIILATRPQKSPVFELNDVDHFPLAYAHVDALGLDLMAPVDDRMARITGLDLDALASVVVNFDAGTGHIALGVDVDPSTFDLVPVYAELQPEAGEALANSLGSLLATLAGGLIGDALGNIGFDLPSIVGYGIVDANLTPAGPGGDYLGVYGSVSQVSYGSAGGAGCDALGCDSGGGASAGCSPGGVGGIGGCSFGATSRMIPIFLVPLVLLGRRRRR